MAWISEIHYKNTYASSSGVSEYVEVSLSPAEYARASDFDFAAYQGTGVSSLVVNLGSLTPVIDASNGYYIYTITVNTTDPDTVVLGNSDSEAVALVDNSLASPVVEFYDIGGGTTNITATNGPASGATSTNIPASSGASSIQFTKNGVRVDGVLTQDSAVICFCDGTLIETQTGKTPVQDLKPGDNVLNNKGEFVPIRWIGGRCVNRKNLSQNPKLYPVRIVAGALGDGVPERDLCVSRQHRILVSSKIAQRVAGTSDVLVAAINLTELPGVFIDTDVQSVRYFHLMFDRHEVIFAENAATESLFTGPEALKAVSPAAKTEILSLFPQLRTAKPRMSAHPIPSGKVQKQIIARHVKNAQPMQTPLADISAHI